MKNEKVRKIVSVCAVMVMVLGLSIAFAYFSDVVELGGDVSVSPGNWNVAISGGTIDSGETYATGNATISGTTVSIPQVNFTAPGQTVRYKFQVRNSGDVDAYLRAITFGAVTCEAGDGTDATMVSEACANIGVEISSWGLVNGSPNMDCFYTSITKNSSNNYAHDGCMLSPGEYFDFFLAIKYTGDKRADGPFTVTIGDTKIRYASNLGY